MWIEVKAVVIVTVFLESVAFGRESDPGFVPGPGDYPADGRWPPVDMTMQVTCWRAKKRASGVVTARWNIDAVNSDLGRTWGAAHPDVTVAQDWVLVWKSVANLGRIRFRICRELLPI